MSEIFEYFEIPERGIFVGDMLEGGVFVVVFGEDFYYALFSWG